MSRHEMALTAAGVVAVGSAALAGLAIWLLLTQPLAMASGAHGSDLSSLVHSLIVALSEALARLVRYL